MLSIGIIGLPNVGKSTLFNSLLKREQALVANYPFATIEPNTGVVSVPDNRLDKLAKWFTLNRSNGFNSGTPPPVKHTQITFMDIAGLVKGASAGEGLGNQFLGHIKGVSMVLEVIRDFEAHDVVREHSVDPVEDSKTIETELNLKDLETLEKKISSMKRNPDKKEELEFVVSLKNKISKGEKLSAQENLTKTQIEITRDLNLFYSKPRIYAFNTDEAKIGDATLPKTLNGFEVVPFSAKTGKGLDKIIEMCYRTLNLISFLTVGQKEARGWRINKGSTAKEAAGAVHSDFEKNFIRAKVINWEKLLEFGSFADAQRAGAIRTEGKDYVVQDGDVIEFLIGG